MRYIHCSGAINYLFISHNLAVVRDICSSVVVMYLGQVVETGNTQAIFENPGHPYTKSLLSAVLDVDLDTKRERIILQGDIPSPVDIPVRMPVLFKMPGCAA
jgi:oligopeptide/dipeptide ABC transporter ATP-binding protein